MNETDVNLENQLKNLVKEGMASPDKTGVYRSAIEYGGTDYKGLSESVALQAVEFEGLIALALLGEKEIVPKLRDALRKDQSKNIKRQIVAEMALQYVESGEIPTPSDEKSAVPKHLVRNITFPIVAESFPNSVQPQEYFEFFTQLVRLQCRLIPYYEATVAIRPLNVEFTQLYTNDISLSNALSRIIQPGRTVSEILNEWPGTFPVLTSIAPMLIWVTPRTGVINVEGENWLFQMHGTNELALQKLPLQLQTDVIGRIEKEGPSVLSDVFNSAWETELTTCLDITYLPGGRIDGVRPLSTWLYAQSTDNKFANLSEEEHKMQLSLLVEQGKLKEWLGHYFLVERSV